MTLTRLWSHRVVRLIVTALLGFAALGAWAYASPLGAGPDDDYHLVSIWCANGGSDLCAPAATSDARLVSKSLVDVACFAGVAHESAACLSGVLADHSMVETPRGNFSGEYPPVYYSVMRLFAGDDIVQSALNMRLFNAMLFVSLATSLFVLLPEHRSRTLLWGWLITLVPLGIFLVPSNNPSGWAITGVGTAFVALVGWFETQGWRRLALGVVYGLGVVMAAGARGDAAVYVVGATVTAVILTANFSRRFLVLSLLPAAGVLIAVGFLVQSGQAGVAVVGFTSEQANDVPGTMPGLAPSGTGLAAYNLLMLPNLWTGVFGGWGLGWIDTLLPASVLWGAVAVFISVGFAGLGQLSLRKAVSLSGVLAVLVVLPVYVLTAGGDQVGSSLQPRYLLPLVVLLGFLLVFEPRGASLTFSRSQMVIFFGALSAANMVSLQVNIRRYVTGVGSQGPDLDAGMQWWWSGAILGPTALWALGSLAFTGMLIALWTPLRKHAPVVLDAL